MVWSGLGYAWLSKIGLGYAMLRYSWWSWFGLGEISKDKDEKTVKLSWIWFSLVCRKERFFDCHNGNKDDVILTDNFMVMFMVMRVYKDGNKVNRIIIES